MIEISLTVDETVSLRTFLVATVFRFSDWSEMETLSGYESCDILNVVIKIDGLIDYRCKKLEIVFSLGELRIVRQCIVDGLMGLSIYLRYREIIDNDGCNFEELAKRLLKIANDAQDATPSG